MKQLHCQQCLFELELLRISNQLDFILEKVGVAVFIVVAVIISVVVRCSIVFRLSIVVQSLVVL